MSTEELLSCPFCGASGDEVALYQGCFVRCHTCHVETANDLTEPEAIAAWNRRPVASVAAAGEALPGRYSWTYAGMEPDEKGAWTRSDATCMELLESATRRATPQGAAAPSAEGGAAVTDADLRAMWQMIDTGDIEDDILAFGRALLALTAQPGSEIRQLCALKDREAIAANLLRHGGLNKHHARAVADEILSPHVDAGMPGKEWMDKAALLAAEYGKYRWETGCSETSFDVLGASRNDDEATEAWDALLGHLSLRIAHAQAVQEAVQDEPVYWESRWFDDVNGTGWSAWERVERMHPHTVADRVEEFREYIKRGQKYELRALFIRPQAAGTETAQDAMEVLKELVELHRCCLRVDERTPTNGEFDAAWSRACDLVAMAEQAGKGGGNDDS